MHIQMRNIFTEFISDIGKRWWILAHKVEEQLYLMVYDMEKEYPLLLSKRIFSHLLLKCLIPKLNLIKYMLLFSMGKQE